MFSLARLWAVGAAATLAVAAPVSQLKRGMYDLLWVMIDGFD